MVLMEDDQTQGFKLKVDRISATANYLMLLDPGVLSLSVKLTYVCMKIFPESRTQHKSHLLTKYQIKHECLDSIVHFLTHFQQISSSETVRYITATSILSNVYIHLDFTAQCCE